MIMMPFKNRRKTINPGREEYEEILGMAFVKACKRITDLQENGDPVELGKELFQQCQKEYKVSRLKAKEAAKEASNAGK